MRLAPCTLALSALLAATTARADEPPPPDAPKLAVPPWILPEAGLRLDVTGELELSAGKVGKPFDIAPDLWFGASDDVTIGVTESRYAATGFRGSAGSAVCLTGTANGCPAVFNNAGVEAWVAVVRGPLSLVVGGGPYAVSFERGFWDTKLGFKSRLRLGPLSVITMPSVFFAVTGRDVSMQPNRNTLYLPVALAMQAQGATLAVGSGVKGPLSNLGNEWQVPVGVSASYAVGNVAIGAAFTFGVLFSGQTNPSPPAAAVEGTDLRVLQVWLSYSSFGAFKAKRARPL